MFKQDIKETQKRDAQVIGRLAINKTSAQHLATLHCRSMFLKNSRPLGTCIVHSDSIWVTSECQSAATAQGLDREEWITAEGHRTYERQN